MTRRVAVWDIGTRLFHWSLVGLFLANAFFTRPGKEVHRWVGYTLAALVLFRLVWGLVGPAYARFASFLPSPSGAVGEVTDILSGRRHAHEGHSPLGALMVYNLLLTMAAIIATGYAQTTVTFFGVEWIEEVHGALVTWAEISVVVHVSAVLLQSLRLGINLPKSMITGYKDLP